MKKLLCIFALLTFALPQLAFGQPSDWWLGSPPPTYCNGRFNQETWVRAIDLTKLNAQPDANSPKYFKLSDKAFKCGKVGKSDDSCGHIQQDMILYWAENGVIHAQQCVYENGNYLFKNANLRWCQNQQQNCGKKIRFNGITDRYVCYGSATAMSATFGDNAAVTSYAEVGCVISESGTIPTKSDTNTDDTISSTTQTNSNTNNTGDKSGGASGGAGANNKSNVATGSAPATVTGTVVDENNEPLVGANIIIPGTTIGTAADINGKFVLSKVPSNAKQIQISFLGYATQTLAIKANMSTIKMSESAQELDEVVVTTCRYIEGEKTASYKEEFKKCTPDECKEPEYTMKNVGTADAKCVSATGENSSDDDKNKDDGTPDGDNNDNGNTPKDNDGTPDKGDGPSEGNDADTQKEDDDAKRARKQQEIAELQQNLDAMKAKEQTTANKIIGAAGIGATGIGGMMVASALSEQKADAAAERDMKNYLETMRCDYGRGMNIHLGETNIELPGGNDLAMMHVEYALLAESVKQAKEGLGMTPGIESEVTIDKAQTGLYDNGAIGKTGGAYASIARALQDPAGADAAAWEELKNQTKKKLKTGAIVAGVGAAGSLVANLIANSKQPKESSAEIRKRYANAITVFKETQQKVDTVPVTKKCSDFAGATGTWGSCSCTDTAARFFADNGGCLRCDNGMEYDENNECTKCPASTPVKNERGQCVAQPATCALTGMVKTNTCECAENTTQVGNDCQCTGDKVEVVDGICKKREVTPQIQQIIDQIKPDTTIADFSISTDTLFEVGSAKIESAAAETMMRDFGEKLGAALKEANTSLEELVQNDIDACLTITGHTDRTKYKNDPTNALNKRLSLDRANAVKTLMVTKMELTPQDIADFVVTNGVADAECTNPPHKQANDKTCRKVTVTLKTGKCSSK